MLLWVDFHRVEAYNEKQHYRKYGETWSTVSAYANAANIVGNTELYRKQVRDRASVRQQIEHDLY